MHIHSVKRLGYVVKTVRKSIPLTQKELAGASGTGVRFIQELEKGKINCSLGKALGVLKMLGIKLEADFPKGLKDTRHGS